MRCRFLLVLQVLLLVSCTPNLSRSDFDGLSPSKPPRIGTGANFIGSGEIYFSSKGSRQRAPFDAQWDDSGTLLGTFYDPFGGTAASIEVTPSGATIFIDGKKHVLDKEDNISLSGMFSGHSFTFLELVRILTGKSFRAEVTSGEPDSTWSDGASKLSLYKKETTEVIIATESASGRMISSIHHHRGASWSVKYSRIKDGFPHEIRVTTFPGDDEFVVLFNRIRTLE